MKKRCWLFGVALLAVLAVAVAACGEDDVASDDGPADEDDVDSDVTSEDDDAADGADVDEPDTPTEPAGDAIELRYGHYQPRGVAVEGEGRLADFITERSNGQITVETHWAEALGTSTELPRLVEEGAIDMGTVVSHHDPNPFPFYRVQQMNFWASGDSAEDLERQSRVINEVFDMEPFHQELESYNQRALLHQYLAPYYILSPEPICSLEDLEGARVRSLGSDYPRMLQAAGATPVDLTTPEMYEALDRGTVDAVSIPLQHIDAFDLHEVASYACGPIFIMGSGHTTTINLDTWNSLSSDQQEFIDDIAAEIQDWWLDFIIESESELQTELESSMGMEFDTLPDEDSEAWQEDTPDFLEEWYEDMLDRGEGDAVEPVYELIKEISAAVEG